MERSGSQKALLVFSIIDIVAGVLTFFAGIVAVMAGAAVSAAGSAELADAGIGQQKPALQPQ